ncbi:MAG: hypothetical protein ACFFAO_05110, partial [Candidatus Hermodarchaeota archaeon]
TNLLLNSQFYDIINFLRKKIATRKEIGENNQEIVDLDKKLKLLLDLKIIHIYKDVEEVEYYALLNDFFIELLTPEYILTLIRFSHINNLRSKEVLNQYLNLLEKSYKE